MKSFALLTLATSITVTTSNDLRLRARPLCTEIETGACRCENNNEIDEYNSPDMQAKCSLGKDLEGNKIKFNFYPWLEKFHNCPVAGDIPAAELQKIWAEGEECWADQNPCDELDSDGISGGVEKCAEMKEKSEMDEEVNGEEEEPVVQVPKDPKLERSGPPLKKALSTGKGSDIFAEPTPFDKALSTEKSILDALWADSNPASLGSAEGSNDGSIHFASSTGGPSIKDEDFEHESRYLATKEFDIQGGGVVEYFVRYNDPEVPGGKQCKDKVDFMLKEFARQKRCEDEKKAKQACDEKAANMCNSHGDPVYESGCSSGGAWRTSTNDAGDVNLACDKSTAQFNCHNPNWAGSGTMSRCNHCKCESGYEGANCVRAFKQSRWSRSVGDPHPNTFNGVYTNLYDGGEFIWFRHPEIPMEARLTTEPKWGVAINKEFGLKRCKSVKKKAGCTGPECYPDMVAPCEVLTSGKQKSTYSIDADGKTTCNMLKWGCLQNAGRYIRTISCTEMGEFNGARMEIRMDGSAYQNSYLNVKSLRDGKGGGIAGHWGGNDFTDTISNSGNRGNNRMYSEKFYDKYRIKEKAKSFWGVCGTGVTGASKNSRRDLFLDLKETSTQSTSTSLRTGAASTKTQQQINLKMDLKKVFDTLHFKMEAMDEVATTIVGDCKPEDEVDGNKVCSATATKWCTTKIQVCSGLATPDTSALAACVKDMVKIGDTANGKETTLNLACRVVKESFANAVESALDGAKEMKQELAEAWPMLLPAPTDLTLQYCVTKCDAKEGEECLDMRENPDKALAKNKKHPVRAMNEACASGTKGEGGWKTFKSIQLKEYGDDIMKKWKRFQSRIPEAAATLAKEHNKNKVRIRFHQHSHKSCFCCNAVAIDQISVKTGGWPVRIIADQRFEVYSDGKFVGSGEWAKRENSIDVNRFRIPTTSQVIGIWVEGVPKARDGRDTAEKSAMSGVIGSIGASLVTSSSWSCTSLKIGDQSWREASSKRDFKEWLTWPLGAELGTNDPGTEPWGQIPGIAKSARWIYSHSTVQNKNTQAYCRIDTDHAWLSYDDKHEIATRWSCKNRKERLSPTVIALSDKNSRISFPGQQFGGQDKSTSYAKSSNDGWAEIKQRGERRQHCHRHCDDRRRLLSKGAMRAAIGDGRRRRRCHTRCHDYIQNMESRSMFIRLNLKDIMAQAMDGSLVKVAYLRLYTKTSGSNLRICNKADTGSVLKNDWNAMTWNGVTSTPDFLCVSATSVTNDWIKIDLSNWVRHWRTNPSSNIGLHITNVFGGHGTRSTLIASPDMDSKNADLRPRLSLSCHGDQAEPSMVFKRTATTLAPINTVIKATKTLQPATKVMAAVSPDTKDAKATLATTKPKVTAVEDNQVSAPWPKGLHDESWIEHVKLPDSFWTTGEE